MREDIVSIVSTDCYDYSHVEAIEESVFKAIEMLEMDPKNIGTPDWSPFTEYVKPGMTVLIKPNLVMDKNHIRENGTDCLYTHPVVVEAVIKLIIKALNGKGRIVIGDAPMQECDFENLLQTSGYNELINKYSTNDLKVEIIDFRALISKMKNGIHVSEIVNDRSGTVIDLNSESDFCDLTENQYKKLRITNYDPGILRMHHNSKTNEYSISDYILEADLIINMPKPKSHKKAGVTISLKNFVGVNTRKEYLPHHINGSLEEGGDEYAHKNRFHNLMNILLDQKNICEARRSYREAFVFLVFARICHKILSLNPKHSFEGSWYANDTISRTISDINRIVRYVDINGRMQEAIQRNVFVVADMIVAGEGEGPVSPKPKKVGIIAAGMNSVCFDEAIATIMGYDYRKIPSIVRSAKKNAKYPLVRKEHKTRIVSNNVHWNREIDDIEKAYTLSFEPSSGWKGHIELKDFL